MARATSPLPLRTAGTSTRCSGNLARSRSEYSAKPCWIQPGMRWPTAISETRMRARQRPERGPAFEVDPRRAGGLARVARGDPAAREEDFFFGAPREDFAAAPFA